MSNTMFDRKLQGGWIKAKLKEIQEFCESNGIDCNLSFGGGFESRSRFVLKEYGEYDIVSEGVTRCYTNIGIKITLTDSDKGDNVKFVDGIMQALLENLSPGQKDNSNLFD